jgi:hypothetical protein
VSTNPHATKGLVASLHSLFDDSGMNLEEMLAREQPRQSRSRMKPKEKKANVEESNTNICNDSPWKQCPILVSSVPSLGFERSCGEEALIFGRLNS